jgi:cell division protein FtsA
VVKGAESVIAGIDVGTTKVCAVIASAPLARIVGAGWAPCEGLKKGVVVNREKTAQSIRQAVAEAERAAGVEIAEALIGIGGEHVRGANRHETVAVARANGEIRESDVRRLAGAARKASLAPERTILQSLPQEYVVDGEPGIREPHGMSGVRLEGRFHVVTGSSSAIQNLDRCVRRAGIRPLQMVPLTYASALAVLSAEEYESGVALIEIGAGTTGIAVFRDGALRYSAVLPVGGWHITNDLAVGLEVSHAEAEAMKIEHGWVVAGMAEISREITVAGGNGHGARVVSADLLGSIIGPRVEEILALAAAKLAENDLFGLARSGVVLTGGTSRFPEILSLAERIFEMPVRAGRAAGIDGLTEGLEDPRFSAAVGLVRYGIESESRSRAAGTPAPIGSVTRRFGEVTEWIKDFF